MRASTPNNRIRLGDRVRHMPSAQVGIVKQIFHGTDRTHYFVAFEAAAFPPLRAGIQDRDGVIGAFWHANELQPTGC